MKGVLLRAGAAAAPHSVCWVGFWVCWCVRARVCVCVGGAESGALGWIDSEARLANLSGVSDWGMHYQGMYHVHGIFELCV